MFTTARAAALALSLGLSLPAAIAQDAPAKKPEPKAKTTAKSKPETADKSLIGTGRDWTKIDTNGDHYISPEEMEVWLKANPATPAK